MKVIAYVADEVLRQGHHLARRDGIERVGWMLSAWVHALDYTRQDIVELNIAVLGNMTEPRKNPHGFRASGVRVGDHICPDHKLVPHLVAELCASVPRLSPLEFYREFEGIHPFIDGNGRVGKILLNVMNGSMLDPIRPPDDFWGTPIWNP